MPLAICSAGFAREDRRTERPGRCAVNDDELKTENMKTHNSRSRQPRQAIVLRKLQHGFTPFLGLTRLKVLNGKSYQTKSNVGSIYIYIEREGEVILTACWYYSLDTD